MRTAPCLALLLLAAACASSPKQDTSAAAPGSSAAATPGASPANRSALASPGAGSARAGADDAARPQQHAVYFDYDSSDIKSEYVPLVQATSRYLAAHGEARLRIEGNCDERGSREYNLALGERRAQALKRALTVSGVPAARIETVSYGEEKPAAQGHDEGAWAKNRRDELVYQGR